MMIFRCKWEQLPNKLISSGNAGRWNLAGDRVIYCSESRALAAFEVLVHMKSDWMVSTFNFIGIQIPEKEPLKIDPFENFKIREEECQNLGHEWYESQTSLLLKVPSVIIPKEWNYLINTQHSDFDGVKIKMIEPFYQFDQRLY